MVPVPDMKARLMAAVQAAPSPTRRSHQRMSLLVVGATAAVVCVEFWQSGGVILGSRPMGFVALTTAGWLLALALPVIGLVSRRPLGPPAIALWGLSVGALALGFGSGLVGNALYPETGVINREHVGLICLELSLAWASLPLTAWVFIRRESDPVHPVAQGAAIGAVAGCLSALLVNLHCPFSDPSHIALGHLLPSVLEVAVGAAMGGLAMSLNTNRSVAKTGGIYGAVLGLWISAWFNWIVQQTCPTQFSQTLWLIPGVVVGAICGVVVGSLAARVLARPTAR